jgi:predicted metal-dependent phosphoesterase TrpH
VRIDLHTHSDRSDGTDSPTELIENAARAGLDVVALTDHDATVGWDEAQQAADRVGVRLVKGLEISTELHGKSVHLLGYEVDPTHGPLLAELQRVLDGRDNRLPLILENLGRLGIDLTAEDVARWSGNAAASGRPHVADALVEKGVVANRDEAFDRLLKPGRPAYVNRYAAPLHEAVRLVQDAGGVAVVAHPWSRGSDRVMTPEAIAELAGLGLAGLEVDHNDHTPEQRERLRAIAAELDLAVTGSSDYHGTGKIDFPLGCHTTAPEQLERLLPDVLA